MRKVLMLTAMSMMTFFVNTAAAAERSDTSTNAVEVSQKALTGVDFVADFYQPQGSEQQPAVLVLGGSEGGKPTRLAKRIAALGYPVLAVAYFKADGLPAELEKVPLDYFDAVKSWLQQQHPANAEGINVVGWSKGAELALLLASRDDAYQRVVAISPSAVVWAGILKDWTQTPSSSWQDDGEVLAFVPFKPTGQVAGLRDLYEQSLAQQEAVAEARINVEQSAGALLLITGGEDEVWPAKRMADMICQRMQQHQRGDDCLQQHYPNAGHILDPAYPLGGTEQSNADAATDADRHIARFLAADVPS
ncbi:dienelactone hydrolase family protein [Idiomarina xiamenensis 10-D-4]|uniref:Dienelactone hydrolase family protein n=2 Tax=Idiomarina xiamenensis TaxID=1207041 RepID=K2K868_9GAMM|nr:dienelactone hydrolase family protein [Idiomarina xiamenensis 10-D-4]